MFNAKLVTFNLYSYPKPEKLDVYKGDNYFEPNDKELPDLKAGKTTTLCIYQNCTKTFVFIFLLKQRIIKLFYK